MDKGWTMGGELRFFLGVYLCGGREGRGLWKREETMYKDRGMGGVWDMASHAERAHKVNISYCFG